MKERIDFLSVSKEIADRVEHYYNWCFRAVSIFAMLSFVSFFGMAIFYYIVRFLPLAMAFLTTLVITTAFFMATTLVTIILFLAGLILGVKKYIHDFKDRGKNLLFRIKHIFKIP